MRNLLYVSLAALVLCTFILCAPATAGVNVVLNANTPSRVFFDGNEIGQTPTTLGDVAPGFHEVRVESLQTREVRVYDIYSPAAVTIQKDIQIQWEGAVAEAVGDDAPPVDQSVAAAEEARRRSQAERNKVRTRNTALGVAVANELFNKGKSKKVVRGVSLGGALLNELIKR